MNPETKEVNVMQEEAFRDTRTFLLFVEAGAGSGKSHEAVMKMFKLSKMNAGVAGGVLVPDYAMFQRDIHSIVEAKSIECGFDLGWNGQKHFYRFPWTKGARTWVFSADTKFPGANLGWGVVNEFSIIPLPQIEEFVERRVRLRCPRPQIELVGTPDDPFGWLEEYTAKWKGEHECRFIHGSTSLNSHNLRQGYVEKMRKNLDPLQFKLWFEGKRVIFNPEAFYYAYHHGCRRKLERRKDVLVHVGLDFNVGNMHAVMGHIVGDGDSRRAEWFHEIQVKVNQNDTEEMGKAIIAWNNGKTYDLLVTCDSSGKARKTVGDSDVQVLKKLGLKVRYRMSNPPIRGRQLRACGLMANKAGTTPRLLVDPKACPILDKDLQKCKQDKSDFTKVRDAEGIYTHSSDAMDYVLEWEFEDLDLQGRSKFKEGSIYG